VTLELQMQQVAYQAALNATAKVIQPSLVDFLR
jgi:flagellar hook-associated protein 3 FlgL